MKNFTVIAKVQDSANVSGSEVSHVISVKYSKFNVSYPISINSFAVRARNLTEENVTPFGQEVNYCNSSRDDLCESTSVPIWTINASQKISPFDVVMADNSSAPGCLTLIVDDDINKTGGLEVNNSYQQQNVTLDVQRFENQGLWAFLDLKDCDNNISYFPTFCFYSYAVDSVRSDYWHEDGDDSVICLK